MRGSTADPNEDACGGCGLGGELICCDSCPAAFHTECAGYSDLQDVPPGDWFCWHCAAKIGRKFKSLKTFVAPPSDAVVMLASDSRLEVFYRCKVVQDLGRNLVLKHLDLWNAPQETVSKDDDRLWHGSTDESCWTYVGDDAYRPNSRLFAVDMIRLQAMHSQTRWLVHPKEGKAADSSAPPAVAGHLTLKPDAENRSMQQPGCSIQPSKQVAQKTEKKIEKRKPGQEAARQLGPGVERSKKLKSSTAVPGQVNTDATQRCQSRPVMKQVESEGTGVRHRGAPNACVLRSSDPQIPPRKVVQIIQIDDAAKAMMQTMQRSEEGVGKGKLRAPSAPTPAVKSNTKDQSLNSKPQPSRGPKAALLTVPNVTRLTHMRHDAVTKVDKADRHCVSQSQSSLSMASDATAVGVSGRTCAPADRGLGMSGASARVKPLGLRQDMQPGVTSRRGVATGQGHRSAGGEHCNGLEVWPKDMIGVRRGPNLGGSVGQMQADVGRCAGQVPNKKKRGSVHGDGHGEGLRQEKQGHRDRVGVPSSVEQVDDRLSKRSKLGEGQPSSSMAQQSTGGLKPRQARQVSGGMECEVGVKNAKAGAGPARDVTRSGGEQQQMRDRQEHKGDKQQRQRSEKQQYRVNRAPKSHSVAMLAFEDDDLLAPARASRKPEVNGVQRAHGTATRESPQQAADSGVDAVCSHAANKQGDARAGPIGQVCDKPSGSLVGNKPAMIRSGSGLGGEDVDISLAGLGWETVDPTPGHVLPILAAFPVPCELPLDIEDLDVDDILNEFGNDTFFEASPRPKPPPTSLHSAAYQQPLLPKSPLPSIREAYSIPDPSFDITAFIHDLLLNPSSPSAFVDVASHHTQPTYAGAACSPRLGSAADCYRQLCRSPCKPCGCEGRACCPAHQSSMPCHRCGGEPTECMYPWVPREREDTTQGSCGSCGTQAVERHATPSCSTSTQASNWSKAGQSGEGSAGGGSSSNTSSPVHDGPVGQVADCRQMAAERPGGGPERRGKGAAYLQALRNMSGSNNRLQGEKCEDGNGSEQGEKCEDGGGSGQSGKCENGNGIEQGEKCEDGNTSEQGEKCEPAAMCGRGNKSEQGERRDQGAMCGHGDWRVQAENSELCLSALNVQPVGEDEDKQGPTGKCQPINKDKDRWDLAWISQPVGKDDERKPQLRLKLVNNAANGTWKADSGSKEVAGGGCEEPRVVKAAAGMMSGRATVGKEDIDEHAGKRPGLGVVLKPSKVVGSTTWREDVSGGKPGRAVENVKISSGEENKAGGASTAGERQCGVETTKAGGATSAGERQHGVEKTKAGGETSTAGERQREVIKTDAGRASTAGQRQCGADRPALADDDNNPGDGHFLNDKALVPGCGGAANTSVAAITGRERVSHKGSLLKAEKRNKRTSSPVLLVAQLEDDDDFADMVYSMSKAADVAKSVVKAADVAKGAVKAADVAKGVVKAADMAKGMVKSVEPAPARVCTPVPDPSVTRKRTAILLDTATAVQDAKRLKSDPIFNPAAHPKFAKSKSQNAKCHTLSSQPPRGPLSAMAKGRSANSSTLVNACKTSKPGSLAATGCVSLPGRAPQVVSRPQHHSNVPAGKVSAVGRGPVHSSGVATLDRRLHAAGVPSSVSAMNRPLQSGVSHQPAPGDHGGKVRTIGGGGSEVRGQVSSGTVPAAEKVTQIEMKVSKVAVRKT